MLTIDRMAAVAGMRAPSKPVVILLLRSREGNSGRESASALEVSAQRFDALHGEVRVREEPRLRR